MAQSLDTLKDKILTSLYGRTLGFDAADIQNHRFLLGVKGIVKAVEDFSTTAAATAVNHGITRALASGSSQTSSYTIQSPTYAGLEKYFFQHSTSTGCQIFTVQSTASPTEYIVPSSGVTAGTTTGGVFCINLRGAGANIKLVSLSTLIWAVISDSTASRTDVSYTTST